MRYQISADEVQHQLIRSNYKFKKTHPSYQILASDINNGIYDFSLAKYYNYSGRRLATFEDEPKELSLINNISMMINRHFSIVYSNRNSLMRELVNTLLVLKSINDFTIIRFDFKKYFPSISTKYIYEHYIHDSSLDRDVKDVIFNFALNNNFCTPGISISNTFAEIIASDFDNALIRRLSRNGILFYKRYIDDGIIILNSYISNIVALEIIEEAIVDVFYKKTKYTNNRTRLNSSKFNVINKRTLLSGDSFDFLGYKFTFNQAASIELGISQKKIDKFTKKINKLVHQYYGNPVLLRHILKANSSRVVYCTSRHDKRKIWKIKGIIANYGELRRFPKSIDSDTKRFLKSIYYRAFTSQGLTIPHYVKSERYNLYQNLMKNKSIVFDEKIGNSKNKIIMDLNQIGVIPNPTHDYVQLTRNYLIAVKVGH